MISEGKKEAVKNELIEYLEDKYYNATFEDIAGFSAYGTSKEDYQELRHYFNTLKLEIIVKE